ncbi:MAG: hypothetical protein C0501_11280 [Isosphaera sp.]|nr:hypothetical protein [Isosphaera sp.]
MAGGVTTDGLPTSWAWATLDEIAEIEGGLTKDQKRPRSPSMREVPYLRVANVQRGYLDLRELKTIPAEETEIAQLRLQPGDILFTEGGDRDKLGRGWVWGSEVAECIHQNHIFRARPNLGVVDPKFVSLHGNHFGQTWFLANGKQTTNLASINKGMLRRFPVPVPPLAEQRRIVAKVEELFADLDAGLAALLRVRAKLRRYRAAVLAAAVGGRLTADWRAAHPAAEPAAELLTRVLADRRTKWEADQLAKFAAAGRSPPKNWQARYAEPTPPDTSNLPPLPAGWCWATVEQTCFLDVGFAFPSAEFTDAGIKLLRGENIEPGALRWRDTRYWPEAKAAEYTHLGIETGDIILAMDRPIISSGLKIARATADDVPCLLVQRVSRFRPVAHSMTSFLYLALQSRRFITHLHGGQTGTQLPHISGSGIVSFPFPLPPLAEQEQIVSEVEERLSQIAAADGQVSANLARAGRLRQAILRRAFAGRLVRQDPADEPAADLLARLRAARASPTPRPRGRRGPAPPSS